ncbi:molybdate transport system ATP-binding protein [Isoptericola sp. CG 20/1183]|uniref:Molybdate transport system ATP-binding protein n=1 Tax=Isoptericola halotolerans TaxID=300560 RepID=A0ABX5ECJ2_9MICO|nr:MULTISPECIES: ABC transporter ATP-binding protein [Isoptericola]PRZ04792.1 molybdate transport system ATP-binding protein [Isoptericola halotolerans]PRZ05283.1 molybdate transport system ATP-binding protein [Isoptericola sp. CG 20/1183]
MTFELTATVPSRGVDVRLDVAAGRTLALLGPNGAGKSTALGLAAGTLRPHDGDITLDGRTLARARGGRRTAWVAAHRRRVALLAQDPMLFPHLSVRDNVAFGPRAQGRSRRAAATAAKGWLDATGLGDLADRRPAALSGGQAQRIAIARALAARPRLLLLDEPMAALDVDVTPQLRQTLQHLLAEQTTVLATHDVLDALLLADEVAVVDGGRVVERGPTAEVLSRPRSAFAASIAGLNLLTGTWTGDGVATATGEVVHGHATHPEVPLGTAMTAVFRPAAVALHLADPHGSPRNTFRGTVRTVEPRGDLLRVRTERLAADVTPQAVAELSLVPGRSVVATVKAAEVDVYRR